MQEKWDWTLASRLDEVNVIRGSGHAASAVARGERRMADWERRLGLGGADCLRFWSTLLRTNKAGVLAVVGASRRSVAVSRRPHWARTTQEVLDHYERDEASIGVQTILARTSGAAPAWPWLDWGLTQIAGIASRYVPAPARALLVELADDCARLLLRTMALEVNVARLRGELGEAEPQSRFAEFTRGKCSRGPAMALWTEYPVLARFLTEATERWCVRTSRLLIRLERDWPVLAQGGWISKRARAVVAINELGDSHAGGQRVQLITFDDCSRVVYKPRELKAEFQFQRWLSELGQRGLAYRHAVVRFLVRRGYGWAEYVDQQTAKTMNRLTFSYLCGSALALAYSMGCEDLTFENVIASERGPCFVDTESILLPMVAPWPGKPPRSRSLANIGLLPGARLGGVDVSGMAGKGGLSSLTVPVAFGWGTDAVWVKDAPAELASGRNLLDGGGNFTAEEADNAVRGLVATIDLLKPRLKKLGASWRGLSRVLLSPTWFYGKILAAALHPNLLRDALDWDALIGTVARYRAGREDLLAAERIDLWNQDVPVFYARPRSRCCWSSSGKRLTGLISKNGALCCSAAVREVQSLQFPAHAAYVVRSALAPGSVGFRPPSHTDWAQDYLATANAIGKYLIAVAGLRAGSLSWTEWRQDVVTGGPDVFVALGADLYGGISGMLVVFSQLARLLHAPCFTRAARILWRQVADLGKTWWERAPANMTYGRQFDCGAFDGAASALYALYLALDFGDPDRLAASARASIPWFEQSAVAPHRLDWISGSAGIAVVLGKLACWLRSEEMHAAARAHADAASGGPRRVAHARVRLPAGVAHGAIGRARAVARMQECCGPKNHRPPDPVSESLQRSKDREWTELAAADLTPWCRGLCGAAVAELESRSRQCWGGVLSALERLARSPEPDLDCLCHGVFGVIDSLISAARVTGDTSWLRHAQCWAQRALLRAAVAGFRFSAKGETLSLMLGLGGVCHTLLRLYTGGLLPSILGLEMPLLDRSLDV